MISNLPFEVARSIFCEKELIRSLRSNLFDVLSFATTKKSEQSNIRDSSYLNYGSVWFPLNQKRTGCALMKEWFRMNRGNRNSISINSSIDPDRPFLPPSKHDVITLLLSPFGVLRKSERFHPSIGCRFLVFPFRNDSFIRFIR